MENLEDLRNHLLKTEAELVAALDGNEDSAAPVALDTAIGRLSRMDAMQTQQMAVELRARQEQQLHEVRMALERMRDGNYGKCRACGQPIAIARLEAMPEAKTCVRCAANSR